MASQWSFSSARPLSKANDRVEINPKEVKRPPQNNKMMQVPLPLNNLLNKKKKITPLVHPWRIGGKMDDDRCNYGAWNAAWRQRRASTSIITNAWGKKMWPGKTILLLEVPIASISPSIPKKKVPPCFNYAPKLFKPWPEGRRRRRRQQGRRRCNEPPPIVPLIKVDGPHHPGVRRICRQRICNGGRVGKATILTTLMGFKKIARMRATKCVCGGGGGEIPVMAHTWRRLTTRKAAS